VSRWDAWWERELQSLRFVGGEERRRREGGTRVRGPLVNLGEGLLRVVGGVVGPLTETEPVIGP